MGARISHPLDSGLARLCLSVGACREPIAFGTLLHPATGESLVVGMIDPDPRYCGNTSKMIGRIKGAVTSGADIVVGPEYSFLPREGQMALEVLADTMEEVRRVSEEGCVIIPGTFVYYTPEGLMYNTAFVFHNGRIIHSQDKITDTGENTRAGR